MEFLCRPPLSQVHRFLKPGPRQAQLPGGRADTYSPTVGHFADEGARGLAEGLQGRPLCGSQDRAWLRLRGLGHFALLFSRGFPIFLLVLLLLLQLFVFFTRLVLRQ